MSQGADGSIGAGGGRGVFGNSGVTGLGSWGVDCGEVRCRTEGREAGGGPF